MHALQSYPQRGREWPRQFSAGGCIALFNTEEVWIIVRIEKASYQRKRRVGRKTPSHSERRNSRFGIPQAVMKEKHHDSLRERVRLLRRNPHTTYVGAIGGDTAHALPSADVFSKENDHSIVYPSAPNTVAPGIDLGAGQRLALILSRG